MYKKLLMEINHYEILQISLTATQAEIKQAYRRLVKLFHPDSQHEAANHDKIILINAAYEVLGDEEKRRIYDQSLRKETHHHRTTTSHNAQQKRSAKAKNADQQLELWLKQVYIPVNKFLTRIINPLNEQIDNLAADPFDDDLMGEFELYLQKCRYNLNQAVRTFQAVPNPHTSAGVAMNLYYCLNQLADGIEELERYTYNYDDHYLHSGQEMFTIANGLRFQAQETLKNLKR
jgi:molecular chaperone DnaJ